MEYSYIHHLDSITDILLYLFYHLPIHPSENFLYTSKLQMLWYYFFNILLQIVEYTENDKEFYGEHLPRIFNYILVYLLYYNVYSFVQPSVNPSYYFNYLIICCNSGFPSAKGELLKSCLHVFKTVILPFSLSVQGMFRYTDFECFFTSLTFLSGIKTQTNLSGQNSFFSLLRKKK